jgi:signal transduction histidine kinase
MNIMEHAPNNSATVMLVTDDPAGTALLAGRLGLHFEVILALGEDNPLEQIKRQSPDLVVVAVQTGKGPELCRLAQRDAALRRIPVLMLDDDEETQALALETSSADSIPRSAGAELLKAKIVRSLARKETEWRLRRREQQARAKAAELESTIEMVAHDLRSPVTAIEGFVRMLRKKLPAGLADARGEEILTHLSKACASVRSFLDDLSQTLLSDSMEFQFDRVMLGHVIEEVARRHMDEIEMRKIDLRIELGDCASSVVGDRRRIVQVLDNLLSNAIRHMGDVPNPAISIELKDGPNFLTATVSDNGVGVPLEHREDVFKRFFRIHRKDGAPGTGLGLSISRSIVENHGGSIWIEDSCNRGAAFSFTIPKAAPRTPQR